MLRKTVAGALRGASYLASIQGIVTVCVAIMAISRGAPYEYAVGSVLLNLFIGALFGAIVGGLIAVMRGFRGNETGALRLDTWVWVGAALGITFGVLAGVFAWGVLGDTAKGVQAAMRSVSGGAVTGAFMGLLIGLLRRAA